MFGINRNKAKDDMAQVNGNETRRDSIANNKTALNYIAESIKDCQKSLVNNEVASLTQISEITETFSGVMRDNEEL
ncbi:MAG: hypothetical protein J6N76_00175, partial [Lachnospiraceae bacterium]|nr:hypothetical protein [Lachnospiraceae bacterium]